MLYRIGKYINTYKYILRSSQWDKTIQARLDASAQREEDAASVGLLLMSEEG